MNTDELERLMREAIAFVRLGPLTKHEHQELDSLMTRAVNALPELLAEYAKLRERNAPPADGAGEVEAINTNDLRDYADRISNPYAQFILDAASQLDYARTDRNILQAELDAERARRAEVEGRHSTGWGSIYWWINAADKHAEYISERGYLIDGDHWQMISSLARATHKDTQDEH